MGPSLADVVAHYDLHDAAHAEIENGMDLLFASLGQEDRGTPLPIASAMVDGWEQRVLAHADAEEQNLFPPVLDRFPEHAASIAALTRDHSLMRILVDELKRELGSKGKVTSAALEHGLPARHVRGGERSLRKGGRPPLAHSAGARRDLDRLHRLGTRVPRNAHTPVPSRGSPRAEGERSIYGRNGCCWPNSPILRRITFRGPISRPTPNASPQARALPAQESDSRPADTPCAGGTRRRRPRSPGAASAARSRSGAPADRANRSRGRTRDS